jgi:hypothetical protein
MAQAVSRRPLTTENRGSVPGQVHVRFVVNKVALGQVFSELSVFPCRFHSTGAPLIVKTGKKTAHHLHWGCTKSLKAVVRGPFIKKRLPSCSSVIFLRRFKSNDWSINSTSFYGIPTFIFVNITAVWDVTVCSFVGRYQRLKICRCLFL